LRLRSSDKPHQTRTVTRAMGRSLGISKLAPPPDYQDPDFDDDRQKGRLR
jgi:hypothetical protein